MDIILDSKNLEKSEYDYRAFISYSHKDKKYAKWLQKKLESFKVPKLVDNQIREELPKDIKPIFLDESDMGTGPLDKTLRQKLLKSKYLIVICSPSSVYSEWVNEEIQTFIEYGREEFIIPFIIEGNPESEKECYPPALSKNILGSSIETDGKKQAFIKVCATILEVEYDQLWQRFKKRQRIQNIYKVAAFVSFAILGTSLFFSIGDVQEQKKLNTAERFFSEGNIYLNSGDINYGLAYLAKSIKDIDYKPARDQIGRILLNESMLILDSVYDRSTTDFQDQFKKILIGSKSIFTKIFDQKLEVYSCRDSSLIGKIGLRTNEIKNVTYDFSSQDSFLLVTELINVKSIDPSKDEVEQYDSNEGGKFNYAPTKEILTSVYDLKTLIKIKEISRYGLYKHSLISPMSNHIVVSYIQENSKCIVETISLNNDAKSWKTEIPYRLITNIYINPNGLNFTVVATPDLGHPEKLFTYDFFENGKVKHTIETTQLQAYTYSNDGRLIAILSNDGFLKTYDIETSEELFKPTFVSRDLKIYDIEFDITDTKLNVITDSKYYSFLLQKSTDKSIKKVFEHANAEHIAVVDDLIITAHIDLQRSGGGYLLFSEDKISPIMYDHQILSLNLSKNNKYLIVGTGNRGKNTGNVYVYKIDDFVNKMIEKVKEVIQPVFKKQLNFPVSLISCNDEESYIVLADILDNKIAYLNTKNGSSTNYKDSNIQNHIADVQFIPDSNYLVVASSNQKVTVVDLEKGETLFVTSTPSFPKNIAYSDNKIIVSSGLIHDGKINCFSDKGKDLWKYSVQTNFAIQKLLVVGNKVIVSSKNNTIQVYSVEDGSLLQRIIIPQNKIIDIDYVDNKLKVLSETQEDISNKKSSIVQTFDIENGKELTSPVLLLTEGKCLICNKERTICFAQAEYFMLPEQSKSINDMDKESCIKIINSILNFEIDHNGVQVPIFKPLRMLDDSTGIRNWLSTNIEKRMISPDDSTFIIEKYKAKIRNEEDEVAKILQIYPSFLPGQIKYVFDYAFELAHENRVDKNKEKYLYGSYKSTIFADFYTKLLLRQHNNNIDALEARARFYSLMHKLDEYSLLMNQIEDKLFKN